MGVSLLPKQSDEVKDPTRLKALYLPCATRHLLYSFSASLDCVPNLPFSQQVIFNFFLLSM